MKFRRARELVTSGTLAELKVVVYRWHNPRPPAMPFGATASLSAAGSIADVGSHAWYDAIRWLIGSEARRVVAQAGVISPPKPDLGAIDLTDAGMARGARRG